MINSRKAVELLRRMTHQGRGPSWELRVSPGFIEDLKVLPTMERALIGTAVNRLGGENAPLDLPMRFEESAQGERYAWIKIVGTSWRLLARIEPHPSASRTVVRLLRIATPKERVVPTASGRAA